jgi:hypothetical protein
MWYWIARYLQLFVLHFPPIIRLIVLLFAVEYFMYLHDKTHICQAHKNTGIMCLSFYNVFVK